VPIDSAQHVRIMAIPFLGFLAGRIGTVLPGPIPGELVGLDPVGRLARLEALNHQQRRAVVAGGQPVGDDLGAAVLDQITVDPAKIVLLLAAT